MVTATMLASSGLVGVLLAFGAVAPGAGATDVALHAGCLFQGHPDEPQFVVCGVNDQEAVIDCGDPIDPCHALVDATLAANHALADQLEPLGFCHDVGHHPDSCGVRRGVSAPPPMGTAGAEAGLIVCDGVRHVAYGEPYHASYHVEIDAQLPIL